jgi:hypothetical protein
MIRTLAHACRVLRIPCCWLAIPSFRNVPALALKLTIQPPAANDGMFLRGA